MSSDEFVLRVRGAGETRLFRFAGAEAGELWRLSESGALERPGGSRRLLDFVRDRQPSTVVPDGAANVGDADFDMVADDELQSWLSNRMLSRRSGRENEPDDAGEQTLPDLDEPSPA